MSSRPPFLNFSSRGGTVFFWIYLFVLIVLFGTAINNADVDLWHRFAVADYFFRTGGFEPGDASAYLAIPGIRPDIEWGSALILYLTYLAGGGTGIVLLKLATLSVIMFLTVRAGLGNRPPTMLHAFFYSLVILALVSSFFSTLRAEASSHVLLALWVFWFQRERRGIPTPFWAYALTMAIWVNLHGGYILGLVWLMALTTLEFINGGDWRRRLKILALCILATLANPFGYKMWLAAYEALYIPRVGFLEWAPVPWFHDIGLFCGYKLLVLWSLVVVGTHLYRVGWRKCDFTTIILLGLFLIPSLSHARHTSLFAIVAGGLLPSLMAPEPPPHEFHGWKPWLHRFIVRGVLVILPLVYVWRLAPTNEGFHLTYPPDTCPIGAVQYLRDSGTTGNLLVGYNAGSYASWELRGRMRVSLNSRYEAAFTYATFQKVQRFFAGENHWQDALVDPKPDAVLVNRPDPAYRLMQVQPGWKEVYQDSTQAVFKPTK